MVKDFGRSEEIAQDVFISALRRMRNTDADIAFKPWIYEIAKNACIDQFRRGRRAELVSYDADEGLGETDRGRLTSIGPTPDAAVDQKLSLDHLRGAFGGLSEAHHDILVMRELEGMSYRQIGERLGMSRASVESTLFRARKRLSEEYEELVSGERCLRVQSIITASAGHALGVRDQRRLARHVSYCQPCRRHAAIAGVDVVELMARRSVGAKIAAVLPLPAFLRERFDLPSSVAQWSSQMAPVMDPGGMASWAKAVIAAATVAIAGVGANTAREKLITERAPDAASPGVIAPSGPLDRGTAVGGAATGQTRPATGTSPGLPVTNPGSGVPAESFDPRSPSGRSPKSRLVPSGGRPGYGDITPTSGAGGGSTSAPFVPAPTPGFGDTATGLLSPPAEGGGKPNVGTAVQETASTVLTPFMPAAPPSGERAQQPDQPSGFGLPQLPLLPASQPAPAQAEASGTAAPATETIGSEVVGSLVAP